uniref:Dynein light intermediate chain n=1 Tax=Phlebotomus papatasi TaxID=29031 RepID=A0A1B0DKW7_PHLPP
QTATNRETEVHPEDEQTFLARQQQLLLQGQAPTRGESPMRSQPGAKVSPRTPISGSQGSPNKKIDAKLTPGTPGGEGVLANFFNSLLNKKSGTPGGPTGDVSGSPRSPGVGGIARQPPNGLEEGAGEKMSVRTDAAAELDRLTRSVVSKKEAEYAAQSDC